MKSEKKSDSTCLIFVAIIIIAVITYKAVVFFKSPDAINRVIDFFEAAGICLGVVILFLVGTTIYAYIVATIQDRESKTIKRLSREYLVRCQAVKMKKCDRPDYIPGDLPEEPGQDIKTSVCFNMMITSHGICITAPSNAPREEKIITDNGMPLDMFTRDWSNPFIIPTCYLNLYYITYKFEGDSVIELAPIKPPGFTDELPKIPDEGLLKIVILFGRYIQKSDLKKTETLAQPLKLKITVLNEEGDYDAAVTHELYTNLYNDVHPAPSDDDDSWMYRSRPFYW